jgi:hypothetical protein
MGSPSANQEAPATPAVAMGRANAARPHVTVALFLAPATATQPPSAMLPIPTRTRTGPRHVQSSSNDSSSLSSASSPMAGGCRSLTQMRATASSRPTASPVTPKRAPAAIASSTNSSPPNHKSTCRHADKENPDQQHVGII